MTNTFTHENTEFQHSGKTGLYLPTNLRRQVDPTLAEKAIDCARRPLIYSLTALALAGSVAPTVRAGDNVSIENTSNGNQDNDFSNQRTRTKLNLGSATLTYDYNKGKTPDEGKLWVNALSRNDWYTGLLVQGQPGNGKDSYADIGACVSKTLEDKTYEAFVGPTVQPGVKPAVFYQLAVRDTSGSKNLVLSLVDDRAIPFSMNTLDFRGYTTAQIGKGFGGIGIRQKGKDLTRIYGGFGFNNQNAGSITVFRYFPVDHKGKFKIQGAFGNPSTSVGLSTVNIWNDMEGPGMRDMSVPFFPSFLGKGKLTSVVEGTFSPGCTDYEVMAGNNFGLLSLGAGINYHKEAGETSSGGLIHLAKSVSLGELGNLYLEGRANTRTHNVQLYTKLQKGF